MLHRDAVVRPELPSGHHEAVASHVIEQPVPGRAVLLATALVDLQCKNGSYIRMRALLDQGSEVSFISEQAAQLLCLPRLRIHMPITGIGGEESATSTSVVVLNIVSCVNKLQKLQTKAFVLKKLTNLLPTKSVYGQSWSHLNDIQLADPQYQLSAKIDIILGADLFSAIILPGIRRGKIGQPIAQSTTLGWIISGPTTSSSSHYSSNTVVNLFATNHQIEEQLRQFWEIEEVSNERILTKDELYCQEYYANTTHRNVDGRYVVRLPVLKSNTPFNFGDTCTIAIKRLKQMEKRFENNVPFFEEYSKFMREYEALGHMEEVPNCDLNQNRQCYLPHHGVFKESSSSTKLRVVFNASSQTTSYPSLNSRLHIGPKLQKDITSIVMNWRKFPVVFSTDIEKMFRQIAVHPDDIDLQRIVWRKSPNMPISHYRLLTVTYGTACAPFLALKTLLQLAEDEQQNYPLASKVLKEDSYVDDILSGAFSISSALTLQGELNKMLQAGGFTLRKWSSNRSELLENLPADFIECNLPLNIQSMDGVKMLGLLWQPSTDTFGFKIQLSILQTPPTKRQILSEIARLYDPLGWLTPVTVVAKMMLQKLWTLGLDWDDPLPEGDNQKWLRFRSELHQLEKIQIGRWIGLEQLNSNYQLHGFCDASNNAYGAVVYICITKSNGVSEVHLLTAKSKVSPIKRLTIPRLELCGALLLTRLLKKTRAQMEIGNRDVYAWSDSKIVLDYIKSDPNRWKVFIANRITEIQETLNANQWRHVPTACNPADCASRGLLPSELVTQNLWWQGPPWLTFHQDEWPRLKLISNSNYDHDLEELSPCATNVAQPTLSWDIFSKYSSLIKLQRVISYVLRFVKKCRTRLTSSQHQQQSMALSPHELLSALSCLIKYVQREHFKSEINQLSTTRQINGKSALFRLNPFLDGENMLRVGGRLQKSELSFETKHPLILPKEGNLTTLLVAYYHKKCLHGGPQLTINLVRQKFWVLHLRNLVRQHIHSCVPCIRHAASTRHQLMGSLPMSRVTPSPPFQHTGVDYAGPMQIKSQTGRGQRTLKGYVAVFVCFSTKAVHLELASDLTSQSFLAAFRRFTSRRGICTDLYSDNGTNFVGAEKELRNKYERQIASTNSDLAILLANDGTDWHFIPPAAPHFGGLWESAVKSCKYHLKRVIGESRLTFEEFATLLAQIEACMNSRPLCAATTDPDDLVPLTPGHFLIGRPLIAIPDPSTLNHNINYLSRWQRVQYMMQQYWDRWSKEYLNQLQHRYKWSGTTDNIKLNDMVLVKDERLPPTKWPIGRVVLVHPGLDKLVRVATIRYNNTELQRPITKLVLLPNASQCASHLSGAHIS